MMIVLLIFTLFCALQAIRSVQLLSAALWLAAVSALIAIMLYFIDAWQIAAIELSVGAGLVTVLMVFAITMVGNEQEAMVSRRFPFLLIVASVLLLTLLTAPFIPVPQVDDTQQPLSDVLWQERGLDLVLQVGLIFSGVLGVIGLLGLRQKAESGAQDLSATQVTEIPSDSVIEITEKAAA